LDALSQWFQSIAVEERVIANQVMGADRRIVMVSIDE
jgi:hypothetical protein|tara:strand:+ start:119 stop:229 length:111 start_codon:yes stop_codon:yes gene_type:complete